MVSAFIIGTQTRKVNVFSSKLMALRRPNQKMADDKIDI